MHIADELLAEAVEQIEALEDNARTTASQVSDGRQNLALQSPLFMVFLALE